MMSEVESIIKKINEADEVEIMEFDFEPCFKLMREMEAKQEKILKEILSFIDEGCDELLIRRIWERALRA